jgi:hypothetical protein
MSQINYRKSSRSGDETNKAQCVEVGADAATICLRDSKTVIDGVHHGAVLRVSKTAWQA